MDGNTFASEAVLESRREQARGVLRGMKRLLGHRPSNYPVPFDEAVTVAAVYYLRHYEEWTNAAIDNALGFVGAAAKAVAFAQAEIDNGRGGWIVRAANTLDDE